ncbi:MAG: hypothetical protein WAQ53_18185 [Thiofilum sp.]|uniref:hypothetical protein n=1 Tax=Thiofilum sp. TaxID=2212733 RepID=UPI0025E8EB63|nr:hypothetical protein [Thiofilum sp.]MBK8455097.1 hypothetical protein [Thiofilum sp.]
MENDHNEEVYYFHIWSYWLITVVVVAILIYSFLYDYVISFSSWAIGADQSGFGVVLPFILMIIIVISAGHFTKIPLKVTMDSEKIEINRYSRWSKKLLNNQLYFIKDINSYIEPFYENGRAFKIKLNTNKKVVFYSAGDGKSNKVFEQFLSDFKNKIKIINPDNSSSMIHITTIYDKSYSKALLYLSIAAILLGVYLLVDSIFLIDTISYYSIFNIIILMVVSGGYIIGFYRHKKK